jgi:MFS family permease
MAAMGERERGLAGVVLTASVGTIVEWYDFFVFGSLAKTIAPHFFPSADPTASFLSTLATFATGFVVRPFGALVFGRLGDRVGRKYAFLVTLLVMGGGTTLIGLVPDYERIGVLAPLTLLALRLLQGLAIGGEYGGAVIYVAEHAPDAKRGRYASFVQVTATAGMLLSLGAILATQRLLHDDDAFQKWGWRLPFFASVLLVGFSLWVRVRMRESPVFERLKSTGRTSRSPLRESLGDRRNWRPMLVALFAVTAGQGVVWYTAHFSALYFLQNTLKLDDALAKQAMSVALVAAAPFFVLFGALSDRFGRRRVMWLGHLLALATWIPVYLAMRRAAGPPPNGVALALLLFAQLVVATMVNGPIPALLVELFPARIRYTSLSLPYHVGNGVFGGLTPLVSQWLVASDRSPWKGEPLSVLYFPLAICVATLVVGAFVLPETRHVALWKELEEPASSSN